VDRAEPAGRDRVWFAQLLRGPACLLVVYTHLGGLYVTAQPVAGSIGHFPALTKLPAPPWLGVNTALARYDLSTAAIGVCVFFLVSGFVIPFSLSNGAIRAFTVRRALRIYPTVWVGVGIAAIVVTVLTRLEHQGFPFPLPVLVSNALLIAPYLRHGWIEPVCWTLAVEELFYLSAALMAARRVLVRPAWVVLVVTAMAAAAAVNPAPGGNPTLYTLAFNLTFLPFIFVGTAIHYVWTRRWPLVYGAAVGAFGFAAFVVGLHLGPNAYQARAYQASAAFALAVFLVCALLGSRLPRSRILDALSSISYPLYLIHATTSYALLHWLDTHGVGYYAALPIVLAFAVGTATLIHLSVEAPTQEFGRRVSARMRGPRSGHLEADART
jgi:peptidoglycan/LPS O-acetylase OafA/YrhL